MRLPAALLCLVTASAWSAADSLVPRRVDELRQAAQSEPPLFQLDTLLSAAELLEDKAHAKLRRELIEDARTRIAALRDPESRFQLLTGAANLLAPLDRREAERICREIPPRANPQWSADFLGRCFETLALEDKKHGRSPRAALLEGLRAGGFFNRETGQVLKSDPESAPEILALMMRAYPGKNATPSDKELFEQAIAATAPRDAALAAEARRHLATFPDPAKPEPDPEKDAKESEAGKQADDLITQSETEDLDDGLRAKLMLQVLDLTGKIPAPAERMVTQAYAAAWFAGHGFDSTATKASELLQASFAAACRCEDIQCDSIRGRRECSENISYFVDFLLNEKIDYKLLQLRHPSVDARVALYRLKQEIERERDAR